MARVNFSQKVIPKWIYDMIEKSRARHTPTMERAFMQDEIEKQVSLVEFQKKNCRKLWSEIKFLSIFNLIRFYRYIAAIDSNKEKINQQKNERNLKLLWLRRFGNSAKPDKRNILNLSDYQLSETEEFVLSHGLHFCLSPSNRKSSLL